MDDHSKTHNSLIIMDLLCILYPVFLVFHCMESLTALLVNVLPQQAVQTGYLCYYICIIILILASIGTLKISRIPAEQHKQLMIPSSETPKKKYKGCKTSLLLIMMRELWILLWPPMYLALARFSCPRPH